MKKVIIISFALLFAFALYFDDSNASPQIMNASKNGKRIHFVKKGNARVNNCNYCHLGTGIQKRKQGYRKGQVKYRNLRKIVKCAGSGCHY